MALDNYLNNVL